jgi:hypothetical protein
MNKSRFLILALAIAVGLPAFAAPPENNDVDASTACSQLPTHAQLQAALAYARAQANGGFNLDMWGTIVNRDGVVCAVAFTGVNPMARQPRHLRPESKHRQRLQSADARPLYS